jgi:hypothetical protein
MKKFYIISVLLLAFAAGAQNNLATTTTKDGQALTLPKNMEGYPGGQAEFFKFINKNFKTPKGFKGTARIVADFSIDEEGNLTNIRIVKDPGYGMGAELARVLATSQRWAPKIVDGKPVSEDFTIPVTIRK